MAGISDVTFSVYTIVKQFADNVGFKFYAASNIEDVLSIMQEQVDRVILVQTKVSTKVFLTLEYSIFFSFAETTDVNAIYYTELVSNFIDTFPRYSKLCVYDADQLKEVPSIFTDTGYRMVITSIEQSTVVNAKIRDNLSVIELKLSGYIN